MGENDKIKECEIVQDLLIGYSDGTLRESSKEFVENHIKECEECKKILEEIKNEDENSNNDFEIDYLKKINKKNAKKNICIIVLVILAIIAVLLNAIVFITYYNTDTGIEVFLEDNISNEEFDNIEEIIKKSSYKYKYKSKKEALESFKENLGEKNSKILDGYEGEVNIFPASFVIKAKWGKGDELILKLENMNGVKKITSNININPYELFFSKIMKSI